MQGKMCMSFTRRTSRLLRGEMPSKLRPKGPEEPATQTEKCSQQSDQLGRTPRRERALIHSVVHSSIHEQILSQHLLCARQSFSCGGRQTVILCHGTYMLVRHDPADNSKKPQGQKESCGRGSGLSPAQSSPGLTLHPPPAEPGSKLPSLPAPVSCGEVTQSVVEASASVLIA